MKKIFTSVFVLSFTAFGFSQSLQLFDGGVNVTNGTITIPITELSSSVNELEIQNPTSNNINFKVNRTVMNPPIDDDAYLYYCTGTQCYSPSTLVTFTPGGVPATIAANSSLPNGPGTYGISAHYDAGAAAHDLYVLYRVYNTAVAGDTSYVTLHYAFATGINSVQQNIASTMTNAYPNPSNSMVAIKYEMGSAGQVGQIAFFDMLGKKVKEVNLEEKQGIAKIDVSGLNSGVYFYSFIIDEKAIVTKKLIVSSK
jgi:hypothetical protein